MKNLLLIFFLILCTANTSYSKEKSCQGTKKGTVEKAGNLKDGVKKLGSELVKPFKKKD